MVLTPAERQRLRRARVRAGLTMQVCTSCGARLLLDRRVRADRQGDSLCWCCWLKTPAGRADVAARRRRARLASPEKVRAATLASVRKVRAARAQVAKG